MPYDYAVPHPRPAQLPDMTLTEPTPPVRPLDLPVVPENNVFPVGQMPPRQLTGSNLSAGRQRSFTGNSTTSLANPQSGWVLALNSAIQRDSEFVDEWQRSMDVLLIFVSDKAYLIVTTFQSVTSVLKATLFGAIVTAFLIETFRELRGQNEEMIALLSEISRKLPAGNSAVAKLAADSGDGVLHRVRRVNRLWFTSLVIIIASAIFAMLAKQWISEYIEGLGNVDSKRTSKDRLLREARLREFRFAGLQRWYVPEIVGALPILLHVALLLFGVGLVDFFWELDRGTAIVVLVLTSITFLLYLTSVALPSFFPDSPYRTPLSHLLSNLMRTIAALFDPSIRKDDHRVDLSDPDHLLRKRLRRVTASGALLEAERKAVDKEGNGLDRQFLLRLRGTTRSNTIAEWAEEELATLHRAAASVQPPHSLPDGRGDSDPSSRDAKASNPQDVSFVASSDALGLQTGSATPTEP